MRLVCQMIPDVNCYEKCSPACILLIVTFADDEERLLYFHI